MNLNLVSEIKVLFHTNFSTYFSNFILIFNFNVLVFPYSSLDNSSSDPITLDNCSPLNCFLHSRFLELLQQLLASMSIPVQEPLHILGYYILVKVLDLRSLHSS